MHGAGPPRLQRLVEARALPCLGLVLLYVLAGRLGLFLAVPPGYASAIFPPAGFAMAAAFIAGPRTLPCTFAGAFLLNLPISQITGPSALAVPLVIAIGSTLQAGLGGIVLRRLLGYPAALDELRELFRFCVSVPLLCLVSASLSLLGMAALGVVRPEHLAASWLTWWLGDTLGVLLFLPLSMVAAGEPRALWRSRARSVALPMLLSFLVFLAVFIRIRSWESVQATAEFRVAAQQAIDKIRAELTAQELFLQQLRTAFTGPAQLSPRDFAAAAANLLRRSPAVQAIEWAPRVEPSQRAAFESAMQAEQPGFAIRDQDGAGRLHQTAGAAPMYPVTYMTPSRGNQPALGFNLVSEPARGAAILRTQTTSDVTATEPIKLVQAPADSGGVLLVLAVPDGANGPGILLVVLRMDTVIRALLGSSLYGIGLEMTDRGTGKTLFDTLPASGYKPLVTQALSFGARNYTLRATPTAFYPGDGEEWQSWLFLLTGVVSTSLLGALLLLSSGERHRFERLLSQRTRERDRIWQVSEDLLGVSNFDGYFVSVNPAWTTTLGWSADEIKTIHVNELRHPDDDRIGQDGRRRLAEGVSTVRMENRFRHKDGSYRWIYWTMTAEQGLIYVIGRDVTADREAAQRHRQTEDQLRQLQKMDSIGQLTGGIAHDFNNLLTVVIGNLELLLRTLDPAAERARKLANSAIAGATRAATLTQRLLAYAQKQPLSPRAVDLNELVSGMAELIRRTQGETIRYEFALAANPPHCFCDANQLETALLNLVINARDAMPDGGQLRIATAVAALDAAAADRRGLAAGEYAVLAVSDSGTGMTAEVAERVFEPFFTTKETGKGTGLGLSMVYGFVKQSKGHVELETAPGRGTTVRILLPGLGVAAPVGTAADAPLRAAPRGNGETILVVEDDAAVRRYALEVLRELGYRVVEARDAATAMGLLHGGGYPIDLLLTDVVMPGRNGRELAEEAAHLRPGLKVLFMTGYSRNALSHEGRLDPDIGLIEKPFGRDTLARRLRQVLHAAGVPAGKEPALP